MHRRRLSPRRLVAGTALALAVPLALGVTPVAATSFTSPLEDLGGLGDPTGDTTGDLTGTVTGTIGSTVGAVGDVLQKKSTITGSDGKSYWVQNNLDTQKVEATAEDGTAQEYLIVWAGDVNVADKSGKELTTLPGTVGPDTVGQKDLPGPDFLAVVDATKGSPTYGEVVNTATVGPLVENEPHHMQYVWHKGDNIFAGGLFTDVTYVFDVSQLPELSIKGVNLPTDTLCGSVPDAYWVTEDGGAYGTYMGGPDLPGPCTYTDGSTRVGNGFGGSPGEVVRLDPDGKTISEAPATPETAETTERCDNIPLLPQSTCANPHGIQAREDLDILVTSDYNEPRNIILNPVQAPSSYLRRPTVRTWDISDKDHPKLKAVSFLPDGPRKGLVAHHEENRAVMETTVTNLPEHKGAFAQTMQGGAIYYAPDITADKPEWREVFDLTASNKHAGSANPYGGGSNGGWVQTSPDDRYLYHAVMGRPASGDDPGSAPYILVLDIQQLLASGDSPQCSIDTLDEVTAGGDESDCPAIVDTLPAPGQPHWGALDNLELGADGKYRETTSPDRLAYANYFVARTGLNGDHRVCVADQAEDGTLSLDEEFRDERTGTPCIDFDRAAWPHGEYGPAKPHSMLFVTADDDIVD
ncbi:hypothetical protein [Nocardioides iriomotensis]|uniref:hypothetical protein n=1 Tax=Nocardioides iriomotensis TaxID=715784 RepID=UPI00197E69E4|nr:hypothetical protein [Nocardioides iriomotensis]